ncbi:MAG: methyltransferase domain-containing protein [Blastocatellia bacterium]|jgi:ubiquinone/menaquinone biosynthesis C-methylase UbiE
MNDGKNYIPALKYGFLTPFYDPILKLTLREKKFKCRLIENACIEDSHNVLDLGCGTGTLTILIKQLYPKVKIFGLDGDSNVLNIARKKATQSKVEIVFDQGMAYRLPYPDNSFDRVVSSLVFHHLKTEDKISSLKEVYRILHPGGQLHLADWGKAQNILMRLAFLSVQFLDGFTTTTDNVNGLLPQLINSAGFAKVKETSSYMTIYGTLSLYQANVGKNTFI